MASEKQVMDKLGISALTAEERSLFEKMWQTAAYGKKLEMAARLSHEAETDEENIKSHFVRAVMLVQELDMRYNIKK